MRASRNWAVRTAGFVGASLLAAACWSLPFYSASTINDKNFGQAKGKACKKNGNPWTDFVCRGHPPRDFADGLDDEEFFRWIAKLEKKQNWERLSDKFERVPADVGQPKPTMRVQAIYEPQRFKLADHDNVAYVMARIIASPRGPKDALYNIGGDPNSTLADTFYVVVRGFIPDDFTPPENPAKSGPSRPISRWTIYGIDRGDTRPRLREMSSGLLRSCTHPHLNLQQDDHASFADCKPPVTIRNFVASERLVDTPLWFTCGIGCCTADFI